MAARTDRPIKSGKLSAPINWLEQLDRNVRKLRSGSDWLRESDLALQRCRRFIMVRFPELPTPFVQSVFRREISRGEKQIGDSTHAERVLRDLKPIQKSQLAGLLLDVVEALQVHARHQQSSKKVQELNSEADRRTRMLFRKASSVRRDLEGLQRYAERLHPSLGLDYARAASRCLKSLANLKEDPSAGEYFRSIRSVYPTLEDPGQLGIVELYWFFRHECHCTGADSEVRVAMIANEFLGLKLKYLPQYKDAESQGCQAVRRAVSRFRPRTVD
jgi:hypothetical protein